MNNIINITGRHHSELGKTVIETEITLTKKYVTAETIVKFYIAGVKSPQDFLYKTKIDISHAFNIFQEIREKIWNKAVYSHAYTDIHMLGSKEGLDFTEDIREALNDFEPDEDDLELIKYAQFQAAQKIGIIRQ